MDEPLFGGRSRRDMLIDRFATPYILTISLLTLLVSLYRTYLTNAWPHTLLGLCTVSFALLDVQLVRWYRLGDLEPHFRPVILHLTLSTTLLSILANMYFFS
ncbi:hypothetical protein GGI15_002985 [Coemansia interrupta]|uniref:Uncharacterized protein n=1 Tax=Coemansia interrupta TaxID=1126814 RepID=A0A9W8LJX2_9FUNG|nr:hypothetical protein GGI15_002985 [Coemansia interrupta]